MVGSGGPRGGVPKPFYPLISFLGTIWPKRVARSASRAISRPKSAFKQKKLAGRSLSAPCKRVPILSSELKLGMFLFVSVEFFRFEMA